MNIAKEGRLIAAALDNYRERLDLISEDLFTETPPGGGWSYAEVYSHILQATMASFTAMERCSNSPKGINFLGWIVMFLGRFPVKIKQPAKVAERMPAVKISKEEAKNLIIKCRKRVDDTLPLIKGASAVSRYKHPRLGLLNAAQWFKFIRIHLQHHLKQLDRIKKSF
ncbi:MAG: DinB superfamily protein [Mucilaginibacter sp.]|nr:DinB superfamily protein [Mucilaginibacter sp.]